MTDPIFTSATATAILNSITSTVTANFVGVAVLLGGMAGIAVLAALVNGAKNGKMRVR